MLHIFFGEDSYLVSQKAQEFADEVMKRQPQTGLFSFNFADAVNQDTVKTALGGLSLFDSEKIVRIKNFLLSETGKNILLTVDWSRIGADQNTTVLIEESGTQEDIKRKFKSLLSLAGVETEFVANLSGVQLATWVKKEVSQKGSKISPTAIQRLIMRGGTQSAGLTQEINKLCNFCMDKEVTVADVDLLVVPKGELNIFDLVDACAQKNRAQAAEFLYKELAVGRDPYQILAAVTYQYRNLLLVGDLVRSGLNQGQIAKETGLHPFVVKKTMLQVRQFREEEELKRAYGLLLAIDTGTKKGMLNLSDELYRFILR